MLQIAAGTTLSNRASNMVELCSPQTIVVHERAIPLFRALSKLRSIVRVKSPPLFQAPSILISILHIPRYGMCAPAIQHHTTTTATTQPHEFPFWRSRLRLGPCRCIGSNELEESRRKRYKGRNVRVLQIFRIDRYVKGRETHFDGVFPLLIFLFSFVHSMIDLDLQLGYPVPRAYSRLNASLRGNERSL